MKRKRSTSKNNKYKLKKYTALVPKTIKATRNMSTSIVKNIIYFLKNTVSTLKNTTKSIDRRTAKSIHSLTKRRRRK